MATKPTASTEWATQSVANGTNSTNNKVESTASHKAFGITFPEPPGRNHLNYWMNASDQWFTYFEEQDTGSGVLNTNYNINAETTDWTTLTFVVGAGTLLKDRDADDQPFVQSSETSISITPSQTGYVVVKVSDGVIEEVLDLSPGYDVVALYKVTSNGTDITQVVDLRSSVQRNIKAASDAEAIAGTDTIRMVTPANLAAVFPTGMITLWSGSTGSIPTGWQICDGTNGTPNLRDRFVVGAGSTYAVDATGGSTTHNHTVTVDNHTLTAAQSGLPSHNHTFDLAAMSSLVSGSVAASAPGSISQQPTTSTSQNASQGHNHTASSGSSNGLPPYYALAYIMKL